MKNAPSQFNPLFFQEKKKFGDDRVGRYSTYVKSLTYII